ncbi:STAS domain-containing protein [Nocardia yunnanensis]|uniref:STAS domain-containing protein n=1 Tax=Nocardia yunnanensis TaxID=2382165 RepID=UPI001FE9B20D|nr:STAS domain-containing protein [Nocardia yunnanensis]
MSRERVGEIEVLSAAGEIDITSAAQLREALDEVTATGSTVVIDLSEIEFIGSVGLTTLLVASNAAPPGRVRVVASTQVRRPVEVTGLSDVLALFDTLEAALAAGAAP